MHLRGQLGRQGARSRSPARKASVLAAQLADLDATFDQVLWTAADLVSDDDVDTVLSRITERAAVAAHAAQFVLAVRPTDIDPLRVHHVGLTDDEVAQLVPLLTARMTPDDDPQLLVVDVVSSRRRYGRLAARYPEAHGFLADERRMPPCTHATRPLRSTRQPRSTKCASSAGTSSSCSSCRARWRRRERCRKSPTRYQSR